VRADDISLLEAEKAQGAALLAVQEGRLEEQQQLVGELQARLDKAYGETSEAQFAANEAAGLAGTQLERVGWKPGWPGRR